MELTFLNLVCFVIRYNFNGKYAPEAGKTPMRTAFFTRAAKHKIVHGRGPSNINLEIFVCIAPLMFAGFDNHSPL